MKKILLVLLFSFAVTAQADVIGQGQSVEGHKVRLTNEKCLVVSGRSTQKGWGRTYSWLPDGRSISGCGMLDNDSVVIEWFLPPGTIDMRRYSIDDFVWAPGFGNRAK